MKVTVLPVAFGAIGKSLKISKGTERVRNNRKSGKHPNYNINKINQYTKKSPVDLRWRAVIQTQVKNHLLTLVRKNSQRCARNLNLTIRTIVNAQPSICPRK